MTWLKEKYNKFKKWIIGFIFISSALAAGTALIPNEPPFLTEVPIIQIQIGERYAHVFIDKTTGKEFEIETTQKKYEALGLKGAGQPKYFNAIWKHSYGGQPIYATSTPVLSDYQFVILSGYLASSTGTTTATAKVLIKMPNLPEKIIDGKFIVENKLSDEGLAELNK